MELPWKIGRNNSIYHRDAIYCLLGRFYRLADMIFDRIREYNFCTYDVII